VGVNHDLNFSDAQVIGFMLDCRCGVWFVEIELMYQGDRYISSFVDIEYVMLNGITANVSVDAISVIQERHISSTMSRDLSLNTAKLAVRFEFQSGSSLLVACNGCEFKKCS